MPGYTPPTTASGRRVARVAEFGSAHAAVQEAGPGGVVIWPKGITRVKIEGVTGLPLVPNGQTWEGETGWDSIIKADATADDGALGANGTLATIDDGPNGLTIRNMTIDGPSSLGAGVTPNGIYHLGGTDGRVELEHVRARGHWLGGVVKIEPAVAANGNISVALVSLAESLFDLDSGQAVAHNGQAGSELRTSRNRYKRFGTAGSNQYHALYPRQSVAIDISRDRFDTQLGTGFAVHHYGAGGTPDFSRIADSFFGAGSYRPILTNAGKRSLLSRLDFAAGIVSYPVNLQADADIIETFFGGGGAAEVINFGAVAIRVLVTETHFARATNALVAATANNMEYELRDCRIPNRASTDAIFTNTAPTPATSVMRARRCRFSNGWGRESFYGTTPVDQPAAIADAAGGITADAEARVAINAALARMRTYGMISP